VVEFWGGKGRRNGGLWTWPRPMDITELVFLAAIGVVALALIVTA
jgi:hypothetical protein